MQSDQSPKAPDPRLQVLPDEQHAQLALREARVLMAPVVRWLLRHGVHYGAFTEMLKGSFVKMAREELARAGAKTTDSAISVMSGVHRKDVRTLGQTPESLPVPRCIPLASQVLDLWRTDARFLDAVGEPKRLPRGGSGESFEALAREVSTDVHPRTLLDELLRLSLVTIDGDGVMVASRSPLPAPSIEEGAAVFSTNAADHIAAAVHNLTLGGPKFLEQSVFVDGLSEQSAEHLHDVARGLWQDAFETMVTRARERVQADAPITADASIRFGVYYYRQVSDPVLGQPEEA
jgi:hypothetical protein